jgi:hypothetical protein
MIETLKIGVFNSGHGSNVCQYQLQSVIHHSRFIKSFFRSLYLSFKLLNISMTPDYREVAMLQNCDPDLIAGIEKRIRQANPSWTNDQVNMELLKQCKRDK